MLEAESALLLQDIKESLQRIVIELKEIRLHLVEMENRRYELERLRDDRVVYGPTCVR